MNHFTFHGVDHKRDLFYTYARDRDKALSALDHRIYNSMVPSLSSKIPATGLEKDSLFYDHLLTNDGKAIAGSLDSFMTREEGIKYALDVASASKAVELSKSSPYSFLDQRQLDRLTGNSMNSESRNRFSSTQTDNIYDSFQNLTNFENLVQAASSGLDIYQSVTPDTRKIIQDASKMAACIPTPSSRAQDKKVWDQFIDYAGKRNIDPLEASVQVVQDWLTYRAQNTGAGAKVEFELQCLLRWRHHAGKPLGPLPWEGAIAKGLLNYLDPSLSDIKGFHPFQL